MPRRSSFTSSSSAETTFGVDERVTQLKLENPEKFQMLVTMHLSFLMDLNDTGLEEILEECSQLSTVNERTNLFFSRRKKHTKVCSVSTKMFGVRLTTDIIDRIFPIIAYLSQNENLQKEGVFRVSGNSERQRELRERLDGGENMNDFRSKFMVNDYATVFKSFLSELPEPLLTEKHFHAYLQIAGMRDTNKQIQCLQFLIQLLPPENFSLLCPLLTLLNKVTRQPQSKMTAKNLAILFTPHIIVPRKTPPSQLQELTEILQAIIVIMINQNEQIFCLPLPFVHDALHYCEEVETAFAASVSHHQTPQKKSLTGHDGDNQRDDEVVISTTYSFTDRRASQEAAHQSNTESALSDLYSHVCQLPESSRKRKLIKEFNKVHGTPTNSCSTEKSKVPSSITASIQRFISRRRRRITSSQVIKEFTPVEDLHLPSNPAVTLLKVAPCSYSGDLPMASTPVASLFQPLRPEEAMSENSFGVFGLQEGVRPVDLSPCFLKIDEDAVHINSTDIVEEALDKTRCSKLVILHQDSSVGEFGGANEDSFRISHDDCCHSDENKENSVKENCRQLIAQQNSPSYIQLKGFISPLACIPLTPQKSPR